MTRSPKQSLSVKCDWSWLVIRDLCYHGWLDISHVKWDHKSYYKKETTLCDLIRSQRVISFCNQLIPPPHLSFVYACRHPMDQTTMTTILLACHICSGLLPGGHFDEWPRRQKDKARSVNIKIPDKYWALETVVWWQHAVYRAPHSFHHLPSDIALIHHVDRHGMNGGHVVSIWKMEWFNAIWRLSNTYIDEVTTWSNHSIS